MNRFYQMIPFLRDEHGGLLQGRQSSTVYMPQIPLLQRAKLHPTPSTLKGCLYHGTPILMNLCGYNNVHKGV